MTGPLLIGLDIGTSGARVSAITPAGEEVASGRAAMAEFGPDRRDPAVWRRAAEAALDRALAGVAPGRVVALAVDGASGVMLALDAAGAPLGPALMYDDPCADRPVLERIAATAPAASAAHGASSGLARALTLQARPGAAALAPQTDWIASLFSGVVLSDENSALKTGYDPVAGAWPGWIGETGLRPGLLPPVLAPGAAAGRASAAAARRFGLSREALVIAGTTDGCASFLATGASAPGDGVTALGSTLTLKILADRPIFAPEFGVYSHKLLDRWLAGGASNTGGAVLLAHFDAAEIARLSAEIDPDTPSGLDYYPLLRPGERFPTADPALAPALTPRPAADAEFLKGMLDGMARIEAEGYRRLAALGAPPLRTLRSVGGGAGNAVWRRMRRARLGAPFRAAESEQAAFGAARLALFGARRAGAL